MEYHEKESTSNIICDCRDIIYHYLPVVKEHYLHTLRRLLLYTIYTKQKRRPLSLLYRLLTKAYTFT